MYLKVLQSNRLNKAHQGSALIIAVFIIVIMTLLGTTLARMMSSSSEAVVYEVLGIRAYQAAQIGLQRKLAEVFPLEPAGGVCNDTGLVSYDFQGLENCKTIKVDCTSSVASNVTYYTITSTGQCEVAGVLTSRTLEVSARKL